MVWHGPTTYSNQHFGLGISSSPSPPKNRAKGDCMPTSCVRLLSSERYFVLYSTI